IPRLLWHKHGAPGPPAGVPDAPLRIRIANASEATSLAVPASTSADPRPTGRPSSAPSAAARAWPAEPWTRGRFRPQGDARSARCARGPDLVWPAAPAGYDLAHAGL